MNDITFKLERIHFNKNTKGELNNFAKIYRIEVKHHYGYISKFDKLNAHTINLHKIIFTKYSYDLLVLHRDEYHKNNNLYLIPNEKESFTIGFYEGI